MNSDIVVDNLHVQVLPDRTSCGAAAAVHTGMLIRRLLQTREHISMMFAAAPSQNEFLDRLIHESDIEWDRIVGLHMDEYIGLADRHPAKFSGYLMSHLFNRVPFRSVNLMQPDPDPERECDRYAGLILEGRLDIVCLGIGENGHIAFNDPGVADFNDTEIVKVVELDEPCRLQQVHDGCFESLDQVPKSAITATVPALMSAHHLVCVVPGSSKRNAVQRALNGVISEECPASVLRLHKHSTMFLDRDSYGGE